jgi:hypothetical protein
VKAVSGVVCVLAQYLAVGVCMVYDLMCLEVAPDLVLVVAEYLVVAG